MSEASLFTLDVPTALDNIKKREPEIQAYINTRLEEALAEHKALLAQPARSALHGVPFSLKDQWETKCMPTTCGSWRFRDYIPEKDSSVFETFRDAGAILVGKSNLPDLGLPPEATSWVGGATRNPYDLTRTAGGSSGGSAAAVAERFVGFEWGADIGGSIRYPAACCGVLGMRLSSETWPISGFFLPVPPTLDWMLGQGPFTTTTQQMRAVLDVARPRLGRGPSRPFQLRGVLIQTPDSPGDWPTFAQDAQAALQGAVPEISFDHGLPSTTKLRHIYAEIWASHYQEISRADKSITVFQGYMAVLSALVFRGIFGDKRFHPLTATLLMIIALGHALLFRNPARAIKKAHAVRDQMRALWDRGYVVVCPVCSYRPPRIGWSLWNPRLLQSTVLGNMADATGLSVPFGTMRGMPRALQLMGPPGSENVLLDLADRIAIPSSSAP